MLRAAGKGAVSEKDSKTAMRMDLTLQEQSFSVGQLCRRPLISGIYKLVNSFSIWLGLSAGFTLEKAFVMMPSSLMR